MIGGGYPDEEGPDGFRHRGETGAAAAAPAQEAQPLRRPRPQEELRTGRIHIRRPLMMGNCDPSKADQGF